MDYQPSEEHLALQRTVRDFARAELAPHTEEWDLAGALPVEIIHAMGDLGLFGLPFPEEWGGSGGDFLSLCLAIEEIGRVDQSVGITLSAGVGLGASPIYRFGTDEQRHRWLPDLLTGRALAAFGLTEPDGGSDAGATRTRATTADGGWMLNGAKAFITNSGTPITSVITLTARTGEDEVTSFIVPAGTPGLVVEPALRQARLARERHARPRSRRLLGLGRRAAGRARGGVRASSGRSSTTGGSPSRRWPSAARRPASITRSSTPNSGPPSGAPSGGSRPWPSPSPIWPSRSRTPAT